MTVAAVPLVDACNACNTGSGGQVIPVDIACTKAVAIARPVEETECLPLLQACGRVLARDTASPLKLPPFDNSAMDGYAVRHAAFAGRGPWRLRVAGTVRPEMLKRPVMRHRTLPFESSPALPFRGIRTPSSCRSAANGPATTYLSSSVHSVGEHQARRGKRE